MTGDMGTEVDICLGDMVLGLCRAGLDIRYTKQPEEVRVTECPENDELLYLMIDADNRVTVSKRDVAVLLLDPDGLRSYVQGRLSVLGVCEKPNTTE